jgi:hypothetical protein
MGKNNIGGALGVSAQDPTVIKQKVDKLGWEGEKEVQIKEVIVEVPVKMCRPTVDIPKKEYDRIHAICREEGTTIKKKLYEVISEWLDSLPRL